MADSSSLRQMRRRKCGLPRWFRNEVVTTLKLMWPTALGTLLQQAVLTVSVAFCGHIDSASSIPLDAAALAASVIDITGITIVVGVVTALTTLATQAWGAKNYHKVGVYLQRCILISALAMVPVYCLWVNIESVLNLLHQPPCVVEQAKEYINIFLSSLPAAFLYFLLQTYLQAQNIVWPSIVTGLAANAVSALFHYLLIFVAGIGIHGAATAIVLSNYTSVGVLLVIIYVRKLHRMTWGGWSRESLKDWFQIARYGFPGFVMLAVERYTFEVGIFVTGYLADSEIQQGIHGILLRFKVILLMLPLSLGIAQSIRVGNELGSGNVPGAKRAVLVGVVVLTTGICVTLPLTLSLSTIAPRIFTSDPCLLDAISIPMFVLAVISTTDWIRLPLEGVVRGSGKQFLGSIINLFCYLAVALPLGIVLATVAGLGATGYWIGLTSGGLLQCVLYSVMILSMNWKKEAEKAQRVAGKEVEQFQESGHELQASAAPSENITEAHSTHSEEGDSDSALQGSASNVLNNKTDIRSEQDLESLILAEESVSPTSNDTTSTSSAVVCTHRDQEDSKLVAASDVEETDSIDALLLPETEESSEADSVENSTSASTKIKEPPKSNVRISLPTVFLRATTLVAMLVLLVVSVTVSQLYVYQSTMGPCLPDNSTQSLNATANITLNATTNATDANPTCAV